MKKITAIILKSIAGLILLVLIVLFTVPVIFKDKIKTKVEKVINESVNASVTFDDYKLTFFRNFPNLSFSLSDVAVVGIDRFEGDTLAGFRSFDLVFNLGSLLSSDGYEVKSILVDHALVNAIVLSDGIANWDVAKTDSLSAEEVESDETSGSVKILLRKFEIRNSNIFYRDETMALKASLKNLNYTLAGNMTQSQTDLWMTLNVPETTVEMEGVRYLTGAVIDSKIGLDANLDSMRFTFTENYLTVNDLRLNFSGIIRMPEDDILMDINFGTENTSFKTLLSLIPAIYMEGYEDLSATGDFTLTGSARGIYSDADSTLPDLSVNLVVNNGVISYPLLPEKLSNINVTSGVFVDGKVLDRTTVSIDKLHFELAGNPFDMSFFMKTPMSDPDFRGSAKGKIDLEALSKAIPMDSISMTGVIEMAMTMAGRLSMIEKEQYESFKAEGTMGIRDMSVTMAGYPKVDINEVKLLFTPAFTQLQRADIVVAGTSDFSLSGNLENYIPYVFSDGTIKGKLSMVSKATDLSAIMNSMASDSVPVEEPDTTALAVVAVPKNIDFDFNALIEKFSYDNIKAENVKGHIIVRDGILMLRETGMNVLGGAVVMNADYDTRDTLKPVMKADLDMKNIAIKDAWKTFATIRQFAPTAKGIDGKVNMQLSYSSLLGSDMMPVMSSINGSGRLRSEQVQLLESATFDKFRQFLKLNDKYTNVFRDINVAFKVNDGRVFVNPFDVKTGNLKMNISGDHGLDQTINYLIKTEIPRSELGSSVNSLIDNLSAQAAAFGIAYKPADIMKVNVRVKGTFTKPEVGPDFSGPAAGSAGTSESAKETVKQVYDNAVDKTKEQMRAEAAAQGDKLIKEAEEKGQQLRDEAARAAQRLRQEADSSAARLIKIAEPKGMLAKAGAQKSAETLKKEADRRGAQLITEADTQAKKLVEEAKAKKEEMINKL